MATTCGVLSEKEMKPIELTGRHEEKPQVATACAVAKGTPKKPLPAEGL